MTQGIVCFVTRHPILPSQRADFDGFRLVHTRGRFVTAQELWREVVFDCLGIPEIVVLTWYHRGRDFAVKYIGGKAPGTAVLTALTEADNLTPLTNGDGRGLYRRQYYAPGRGIVSVEWKPEMVTGVRES